MADKLKASGLIPPQTGGLVWSEVRCSGCGQVVAAAGRVPDEDGEVDNFLVVNVPCSKCGTRITVTN